ncbi:MAG: histidine kinase N-terminal 7TM domain-containing protein [Halobacteriales archaeon]|nr:histidine kinase N-terminal 7TM domain-containing protein [Halobacteriales archaeon]
MFGLVAAVFVFATLAAGVATVGLVWYLDRHRGNAGANWFISTLTAQVLVTLAYALAMLTTEPTIRAHLEALSWTGLAWMGPLFMGFALEYTGRERFVHTYGFGLILLVPTVTTALALTHPYHGLLWQGFELFSPFGLSGARYIIQPWGYLAMAVTFAAAAVGVLLLVETTLAYGRLYRREAAAIALSTVFPAIGLVTWLLRLGPYPGLNFTPVLLLPHSLLDAYAFVGTHMFETNPTTQRAAERSALDDLEDPLFAVDTEQQIVNLNHRAQALFGVTDDDLLPVPVESLVGTPLDVMREEGEITVGGPDSRIFAVSYTELTDTHDTVVGGLVVLYDVTDERQQKQQLTVLNRILRHNMRNEMTVIKGHANLIRSGVENERLELPAEAIVDSSERLLGIAEKAQDFDSIKQRDPRVVEVDAADLLAEIQNELLDAFPDATIDLDVRAGTQIHVDPAMLTIALSNLVENALDHGTGDPYALVSITRTQDGRVECVVADRNDRIGETEIAPIQAGDETQLEHGSSIGLWIVKWSVTAMNADIDFDYDDGNVITITLST